MVDYCTSSPDRIRVLGLDLAPCCKRHDEDYAEQRGTRLAADLRFLRCFALRGWREGGARGVAKTPAYLAVGLVYFAAVRVAGGRYWRAARPPVHARSPVRAARRIRRRARADHLRKRRSAFDRRGHLTPAAARRLRLLIEDDEEGTDER